MYMQRIPQETKWEELTEDYILKTKRACMRARTINCGISIIALYYWGIKKQNFLTNDNFDSFKTITVREMVRFAKKNFVRDIKSAFDFAESQMHGNDLLNPIQYDYLNAWIKVIGIEDFNYSMLSNNIACCKIFKDENQVMISCTYPREEAPFFIDERYSEQMVKARPLDNSGNKFKEGLKKAFALNENGTFEKTLYK